MSPEIDIYTLLSTGLQIVFYVFVLLFTIQAIFFSYHWFKFGSSKHISLVAFSIYLIGGAFLLLIYTLSLS